MFAALHVARFALASLIRQEPALGGKPVALIEAVQGRRLVFEMTPSLEQAGVEAGMEVGQVLARCSTAEVRSRCPEAEASAGRLLAARAQSAAPLTERTAPGLHTLDLKGLARGWAIQLLAAACASLEEAGLPARAGLAPTPELAGYAARMASSGAEPLAWFRPGEALEALEHKPLELAPLPPSARTILHSWGIRELGALARLPRQALGLRLGEEALAAWDALNGRTERPLHPEHPPQAFREIFELEYRIETLEPLLFLVRRAIDSLAAQLEAAHQAAHSLELDLLHENAPPARARIRLPEPTRDRGLLYRVLETHLQSVQTEHPLTGFALEIGPVDPHCHQHGLFETTARNPWRLRETLDRLAGLVGDERVGRPVCEATFRPDAFRMDKLPTQVPPLDPERTAPPEPGLALRRWRPSSPVRVELCGERPAVLDGGIPQGRIVDWRGPWTASGEWWRAGRWQRREWDVELVGGGLYRLVQDAHGWSVEGSYD